MPAKFLLHTCCAPCGVAVIDELRGKYGLTVFFYNPNIHPKAEYLKRKKEVVKICKEWGIPMVDMDEGGEKWAKAVKNLETEPEGGKRCPRCFWLRLSAAAEYGAKNKFDIFGTTLTMGRNKKAEVINPIGQAVGRLHNIEFYPADWKKKGRQEKGKKMTEERGIYRQKYCGCAYSVRST